MEENEWRENLSTEIEFWRAIISGDFSIKRWVEDFKKRINGKDIVPSRLKQVVYNSKRILDVGSGPATLLGGIIQDKTLNITAIDPLASEYEKLYNQYHTFPLIRPKEGKGENLLNLGIGTFDLVYSCNALDHTYDPILSIQNMIDICEVGGKIIFENSINEGEYQKYLGLHKWNFMPVDDDLVIWNNKYIARLLSHSLCKNSFKKLVSKKIGDRFCQTIIEK